MTDLAMYDGDKDREPDDETYVVEGERLGGPVDADDAEPSTLYGTILSSRDEPRPPIVPAWLRNADQRAAFARQAADAARYITLFHLLRSPKYAAKVAWWAPVGLIRGLGRLLWWARAEEGNWHLRQHEATRGNTHEWLQLDLRRARSARARWWAVAVLALVAAVGYGMYAGAPVLLQLAAAVVGVLVLARIGRPVDKPITDRTSSGPRFTKLTAEMVRMAMCSIGIAGVKEPGQISFPPPGIHRDGPGWLARINLPAGVEAVDVLERRGRLSSALRLPVDQVWPAAGPDHAGQVDLWVGYLPASKMGQPRWSLLSDTARCSVFEPAEFATDQRQRPVTTVLFARNFLLGGVPGSGKSFGARTLATIAALDPTVELKIAEFKGTADFGDFEPLCSTYVCGVDDTALAAGAAIIHWGLAEAERRGRRIRAARERGEAPEGKVTPELAAKPGSGLHPVVIVIDEVHELFGDGEIGKETAAAAERLIKRGRALGIIVILATQIPDRTSLPPNITRCVTVRWCLAVQDQVANDMILGTGAYKRGMTATVYRPGIDAGWGIATGIEQAGPVRSHYPGPDAAASILARAAALRGTVVGDAGDLPAARDLVADALSMFEAGERGLQWERLADRLAERLPEAYPAVSGEALSALLRGRGVASVDVKFAGSVRKGCRRADLQQVLPGGSG